MGRIGDELEAAAATAAADDSEKSIGTTMHFTGNNGMAVLSKGRTVEGLRKPTKSGASDEVLVSSTASSSFRHRRGLSQGLFRRPRHYPALIGPRQSESSLKPRHITSGLLSD